MMRDQFANYVVQKMLDVVDGEQRDLLLSRMKPHFPSLRKFTYGKHILTKVEKLLGYSLGPDVPSASADRLAVAVAVPFSSASANRLPAKSHPAGGSPMARSR